MGILLSSIIRFYYFFRNLNNYLRVCIFNYLSCNRKSVDRIRLFVELFLRNDLDRKGLEKWFIFRLFFCSNRKFGNRKKGRDSSRKIIKKLVYFKSRVREWGV